MAKLQKKILKRAGFAALAATLAITSIFVVSKLKDRKEVKYIANSSYSIAGKAVEEYSKEFLYTADGVTSGLDEESSKLLATTVTNTMKTYLSSTAPGSIQTLSKNVESAVNDRLTTMGINLSKQDQQVLTSGITSIVISSVYKAIADRGLISTADLDTMRKGLEARMGNIEGLYRGQASSVQDSIDAIYQYVEKKDFSSVEQMNAIQQLRDRIANLNITIEQLQKQSGSSPEEIKEMEKVIKELETQMETIITTLEKENNEELKQQILAYQKELEEIRKLLELPSIEPGTVAQIGEKLETLEKELTDRVTEETKKFEELNKELSSLSGDFTEKLLQLTNVQNNLQNTLNILSLNVGEGSVDERITNVYNEVSNNLTTNLNMQKNELTGHINGLNDKLQETGSLLGKDIDSLAGKMSDMEALLFGFDPNEVLTLRNNLQELSNRLDNGNQSLNNLSTSLVQAKADLQSLINGNSTDIAGLLEALNQAKSELSGQMETADQQTKEEINGTIDTINDLLALMNGKITGLEELLDGFNPQKVEELQTHLTNLSGRLDEGDQTITDSLNQAKTELQNLIDGNTTDISSLLESLKSAKEELTNQMATADEQTKEEINTTITDINGLLALLEGKITQTQNALQEAKQTLNQSITTLQQDLNTASSGILKLEGDLSTLETELTNELGTKANKQEVDTELGKKADSATVNQQLDTKADKTEMTSELEKKANKDEVTTELGKKADSTTVNQQLDSKADKTEMTSELEKKANKDEVTTELGKKADSTTVNQQLDTKASKDEVTTELGKKADSTTVNQQLGTKADSTDVQAMQQRIEELENALDSIVTYSDSNGKPTLTIGLP